MVKEQPDIQNTTILFNKHPNVWINKSSMNTITSNQQSTYIIKRKVPKLNNELTVIHDEPSGLSNLTEIKDEVPKNIVHDFEGNSSIHLLSIIDLGDKPIHHSRMVECWRIRSKIEFMYSPNLTDGNLLVKQVKVIKRTQEIKGDIVIQSFDATKEKILLPFSLPFQWTDRVKRNSYFHAVALDWTIRVVKDVTGSLELLMEGFILWRKRKYYFNSTPTSYVYGKFHHGHSIQNEDGFVQNTTPTIRLLPDIRRIQDAEVYKVNEHTVKDDRLPLQLESNAPRCEEVQSEPDGAQIHYPVQRWVHPFYKLIKNLPPQFKISTIYSNGVKIPVTELVNVNAETGEIIFISDDSHLLIIKCSEIDGLSFATVVENKE